MRSDLTVLHVKQGWNIRSMYESSTGLWASDSIRSLDAPLGILGGTYGWCFGHCQPCEVFLQLTFPLHNDWFSSFRRSIKYFSASAWTWYDDFFNYEPVQIEIRINIWFRFYVCFQYETFHLNVSMSILINCLILF